MSSENSLLFDRFDGVLLGTLADYQPDRPEKVFDISDGQQVLAVVAPNTDLLHQILSSPLQSYRFRLVDLDTEAHSGNPSVLSEAWNIDEGKALWQLPPTLCPVPNVLVSTLDLIDEIQTEPLRKMVKRVFADRTICHRFWTMPASARHHHAWPGGLAAHSLEVALDLATQTKLDDTERDLAIAGGLLHDIGKVWSYTPDMFQNRAARAMGHELVGLSRLERELRALEGSWDDGAYAMRVLLSGCGRMRSDGSMPSALVARIKAADQRSCELERALAPSRQWRPAQWQPANADPFG